MPLTEMEAAIFFAAMQCLNEQMNNTPILVAGNCLHSYEAFFAITALDSATDLPHSTWYMTTKIAAQAEKNCFVHNHLAVCCSAGESGMAVSRKRH